MRKKQMSQQMAAIDSLQPQQHFICDLCARGRRPKVETILALLCSLQKLPVRILEGELLQCLAERAINWQNRAREALKSHSDLANAYSRVLKLQTDPTLHLSQTIQMNVSIDSSKSLPTIQNTEEMAAEEATAQALLQLQRSQPNSQSLEMHSSPTGSTTQLNTSPELSPLKHKRKSPLVLRETATQPLIDLSPQSMELLSELLFEGNCLEVALDETSQLWAIWHMSQPNIKTVLRYNNIEDNDLETNKRKLVSDSNELEIMNKKKKQLIPKEKIVKKTEKSVPKVRKSGKKSKSDDTDELCSMGEKCVKPNVLEVNWVQCDGPCSGWYHQLCIGVENPEQFASLEHFFCINCRKSD